MSPNLSPYHLAYSLQSDDQITHKLEVKKEELRTIFEQIDYKTTKTQLNVGVMGCADKRFIEGHTNIFNELLQTEIDLFTFDITVDHLPNDDHIIQHDCTMPYEHRSFDIMYSHVLLKFIEPNKQCQTIKHAYEVLDYGGIAIHIMDDEEIDAFNEKLEDGYYAVPLTTYCRILQDEHISYQIIEIKYGKAMVLFRS